MIFNFFNIALAVGATYLVFGPIVIQSLGWFGGRAPGISAAAFFLVNTVPVAIIISLVPESRTSL